MRYWISNDQKMLKEMREERKKGCQAIRRRLAESSWTKLGSFQ